MTNKDKISLILQYCMSSDLCSYDPYDVWKTVIGLRVKNAFNNNKVIGVIPAVVITLLDLFFNKIFRCVYSRQEYPIVRATAAQALIHISGNDASDHRLVSAKRHIDWLIDNSSVGYSGLCWGLGFVWPAGKGLVYDRNTPFTTHTPYALEAIHKYIQKTGDISYVKAIESIFSYYENDVKVIFEDSDSIGVSYGPMEDRLITNAVSYTLYAYSIFYIYMGDERNSIERKILMLFNFIRNRQLESGAWLYEPYSNRTFIDCFHSCFIIKNIIKASKIFPLAGSDAVIRDGYQYIVNNFYDERQGLMRRFSLKNKPSLVKYDLYDNAEFFGLALLLGDIGRVEKISESILDNFVAKNVIFSVIDIFGIRRNVDTLRWAVMPYIYSISTSMDYEKCVEF
jgi:hypothetical protein